MALASELEMRPLIAHCHLGLGRASRLAHDPGKAEQHYSAAIALFREMDMAAGSDQAAAEAGRRPERV
jgi:hypothetical protein